MAGIKGLGEARTYDGSPLRIAILHARWNGRLIEALVAGARAALRRAGVRDANVVVQSVPGSYELPYAVQRLWLASQTQAAAAAGGGGAGALLTSATDLLSQSAAELGGGAGEGAGGKEGAAAAAADMPSQEPFDAIIAIGALIKGASMHFEYISDAVSHGLMRVQLETGCPVVFGLLTLLNEEQGLERAGLDAAGKGHNHGEDWGAAAVELGVKRRGWSEGKFVE